MHIKNNIVKIFQDSVINVFSEVLKKHDLQLRIIDERTFKLFLGKFCVKIYLDEGHLPIVYITISLEANKPEIGILNFVEYQNPTFEYIDFRIMKPEEIPQKVMLLAKLFQKYCGPFLRGDFSIWPKVVTFVDEKIKRTEKK
ncbi:MAG: hypothetical protein A2979_00010 [Deltaproteobacteria bacterium RIFCSPLOWO2_01_FULL_45_74]|nr:MAG: hypothetical protein A2712_04755 [Deltaproteobacteria bacterium RIFCSPHIGHO2_01_FULL_43_49]OGQ15348.1 MAG: hypothetical protein A3D22_07820 [Deltaproteobacteria bacterium RIFCSPHIGHO2_02_FULL_44_53]OGQ31458.1 MAG: hypothetical protein A2979_00010 [Deltaproteobacteria bacterium RIFCSPLOWO2_01_FULL_45_74]OGQ42705.1 MAG: hypothetical protein A3I70_03905 [Deltaproteobacteria bacterium RIFCSPLOWO2_02_FULL_44_34]